MGMEFVTVLMILLLLLLLAVVVEVVVTGGIMIPETDGRVRLIGESAGRSSWDKVVAGKGEEDGA